MRIATSFEKWGPLTVLIVALVLIGAATGGVICATHPSTLDFNSYLSDVSKFVIGLGALGIGHGIANTATEPGDNDALAQFPVTTSQIPPDVGDAGKADPAKA